VANLTHSPKKCLFFKKDFSQISLKLNGKVSIFWAQELWNVV